MIDYKKTISILTVSYNQGEFIAQTIKSVIFQDGDFFIEYLIVDGGSTDNTLEILKKYKNLIENKKIKINCLGIDFKFISEKDEGPTNALNKGLRVLKGNIIGILNSDDIYLQGVFNKVIKAFQSNPEVEIVYGDVVFVDQKKKILGIKKGKDILSMDDFENENMLVQPEVFIKASVFKKIGIFDETLAYVNDYEFWIRALKNNIKFLYIPEKIVYFRKRKDARSSGIYPQIIWETLLVQYKYFNHSKDFLKVFLKNMAEYAIFYSQKNCISLEESFNLIKSGVSHYINSIALGKKDIRKAKGYMYTKQAILLSFHNKKYAVKYFFYALCHFPLSILSKNGLVFFIRIVLQREKIYFSLKNLIWDKLGLFKKKTK